MAKMGFKKGAAPKLGKTGIGPKPGGGMATLSDGTTRTASPAAPPGRPVNPLAALGAALGGAMAKGGGGMPGPKAPKAPAPKPGRMPGVCGLAIGQRPKLGARTKAAIGKMPRGAKGGM